MNKMQSATARMMLISALVGIFAATATIAGVSQIYQIGQSIEVREGDSWSAASVLQKEGRKYLVHYTGSDASMDEWVGMDRMRVPGSAGAPATPQAVPVPVTTPSVIPVVPAPLPHHAKPGDMFPGPDEVIGQTEPNRSAVEVGQTTEAPATWTVAPDPAVKPFALESWRLRTKSIDEKMSAKQLLPCTNGGAIIGFADFFDKARRVERVGAKAASALAIIPPQCLPMAASPSGTLLVCRGSAFGFGNNARIDAFTLSAGATAAVPLVSFTPYAAESSNGKAEDIQFVAALSDTRVITCDNKGRLIAWDIAANSVTGIWRIDMGPMTFAGFGASVVLSPGGKWLACSTREEIVFVDPTNGHLLGKIAAPSSHTSFDIACSPTGKTLIGRGGTEMLVSFDVATGKQLRIVAEQSNGLGNMICADDGFALMDGRMLINMNTGASIPEFQQPIPGASLVATGPGVTLVTSDLKLSAFHLPDAAIRSAVAASGDSQLALKPGMSVKLDIQLDLSDQEKTEIDTAIRKKLTDDGFVISDDADITVVCRTEPGEQHEYKYNKTKAGMPFFMMPGGPGTSMILTTKVTRLTITQKGLVIWERKRDDGPPTRFQLRPGESLEDGAKASMHYDPKFLISLTIPPYIAMPQKIVPAPADHRLHRQNQSDGKPV